MTMSNQKRLPHQPQQPQQLQYPSQGHASDMAYTRYGAAPWQAAHQIPQQHMYYPPTPQQYASVDGYAYAASPQMAASFAPQQHQQYHQAYAPPPHAAYNNVYAPAATANYLMPDYTARTTSADHSPNPSIGTSRLANLGASPILDAQVGALSLAQPAAVGEQTKSEIALRYPALPPIPPRPSTPSELRSAEDQAKTSSEAVSKYVSSLHAIIATYEQRDELLRLRTEAVGFEPKLAYLAWQSASSSSSSSVTDGDTADPVAHPNPILGVRLLQRLSALQRENDELGRLVSAHVSKNESKAKGVTELQREVDESHALIAAMDAALSAAELQVDRSEKALQAACRSHSTVISSARPELQVAESNKSAPNHPKPPARTKPKPNKHHKDNNNNAR